MRLLLVANVDALSFEDHHALEKKRKKRMEIGTYLLLNVAVETANDGRFLEGFSKGVGREDKGGILREWEKKCPLGLEFKKGIGRQK